MGNLDFPQAVEEIKQAAKWLREQGAPKVPLTVHLHHKPPPFSSFYPISNTSFPCYSHKLVHQSLHFKQQSQHFRLANLVDGL